MTSALGIAGVSVSSLQARRGAGLGNEAIGWAKAYIGARELGLRLVSPPWGVNPRPYRRELGATFIGDALYAVARTLPAQEVTSEMIRSTGRADYAEALRVLRDEGVLRSGRSVLHRSGMHGGYVAIATARDFLRSKLLGRPDSISALERLANTDSRSLRVAVHFRAGDFGDSSPGPGDFNTGVPLKWYVNAISSLQAAIGTKVDVFIASDSADATIDRSIALTGANTRRLAKTSVGDLAVLSSCDLLLASVSSFSMLAAFLSDQPYVWYRPQLSALRGWKGIWAQETLGVGRERTIDSIERISIDDARVAHRGVAIGDDPTWGEEFLEYLRLRVAFRARERDLIYYGVIAGDG